MVKYLLALLTILATLQNAVAADPYVTGTYAPSLDGYLVQFTVHNTTVDELVWSWSILTFDAQNPVAPIGWHALTTSREVNWETRTPGDMVQPGGNVTAFGYTSQSAPGTLHYSVNSYVAGYSGSVTPELMPEPSSLLALGVGGLGLIGAALRRRGHARQL